MDQSDQSKKEITEAAAPGSGTGGFSAGSDFKGEDFEVVIHGQQDVWGASEPQPMPGHERQDSGDRLQVEIPEGLLGQLQDFGKQETRTEQGALLLGRFEEGNQALRVQVEAWLEARYARNQPANITFTHKTWEYLAEEQETRYPHLQVVGWFHTHPGFGVFLSRYDLFIHKYFFRSPGQVALVYDPLKESMGLFYWKWGAIQKGAYQVVKRVPKDQGVNSDEGTQRPSATGSFEQETAVESDTGEACALLMAGCLLLAGTVLGMLFFSAACSFLLRE